MLTLLSVTEQESFLRCIWELPDCPENVPPERPARLKRTLPVVLTRVQVCPSWTSRTFLHKSVFYETNATKRLMFLALRLFFSDR